MMRLTIRKKFTAVLLLFAFISLIFAGYIYFVSQQALKKRIGHEIERQANSMVRKLDGGLYERYRGIARWGNDEVFIDVLEDDKNSRIQEFLENLKQEHGNYSQLLYADNSGKVIAATQKNLIEKNVSQESWFENALSKGGVHAEDVAASKLLGQHVVTFAIASETEALLQRSNKLSQQGFSNRSLIESLKSWKPEVLGVLVAFVYWSEFMEEVNSTHLLGQEVQNSDTYAIVTSQEGVILTQPFFENEPIMFHQNFKSYGIEASDLALTEKQGYTVEAGRHGDSDFIGFSASKGYKDFEGFGWLLYVFQSESLALSPIRPLLYQIGGIGLFLTLITLFMSFRIGRTLTSPLVKLVDLTKKISEGDYNQTLELKTSDELGTLASSFNDMAKSLGQAKGDVAKAHDYTDNIIRSTVDCLFVASSEGMIQKCNPAVTNLLKFSEEELLGKSLQSLFVDEPTPHNDIAKRVRIAGVYSAEMQFKTKDGDPIPMLISATTMKGTEDQDEGIVLIAKDITSFKNLEQQFQRAQRMDAVGRLSGGIAHDFNNMLTIILGYSEKMIRKMGEDDPRGGEIGQVLKAGKRAAGLVRQLLTFSRRQVVKPQVINLNELVLSMHKMLKHMTGENIEIVAIPSEDIWPVKIDPGQFEQVIANLTVNARDAMPKGGKIILSTENLKVEYAFASEHPGLKVGDYVVLSCADTGSGMSEEVKKNIFEPFFTTKGKDKGTGLGLATCYGMVKQAGGYIDVETELGKGTTFKLYLPRTEGEVETLAETGQTVELPRGHETIMVVEDEGLVRGLVADVLKEQGYDLILASNGAEALRVLEAQSDKKIDLLLSDIVMPEMGGRELAVHMKKIRPETKILFMSGYVDDEEAGSGMLDDQIPLLQKPVTPTVLAVRVREVIDGKVEATKP